MQKLTRESAIANACARFGAAHQVKYGVYPGAIEVSVDDTLAEAQIMLTSGTLLFGAVWVDAAGWHWECYVNAI